MTRLRNRRFSRLHANKPEIVTSMTTRFLRTTVERFVAGDVDRHVFSTPLGLYVLYKWKKVTFVL